MKKTLIALVLSSFLCAPTMAAQSQVQEAHTETAIGLGTGALVGGVVAGPFGAFIGAFVGGLLGDSKVANDQIAQQQKAIAVMQSKTNDYQQVIAQNNILQEQVEILANKNEELSQSQLNNVLAMSVQFKTGSSVIEPHFIKQLESLVQILNNQPQMALDLTGFADQRGDEQANLLLSKARASAVYSYLIKQGISHHRLTMQALGEQHSVTNNNTIEDNVFDRRVTLTTKAHNNSNQMASN
ncbi:sortase-associated OmpA-like protein PdsO [Pseudoalteromonas sp. MMG010]|uniref:sortase-associated OmpA-like protein PdsO n=1 Tax=Pseudoalteromonas sp. MMG010 TaxID=2822685 RepID=UPI001B3A5FA8|nr:sortase-associated OmpA-like protein PdsO [Pseudoalteromonas sp. MMG010]MBQ4832011.1 sortase-associated OmpA-like protein PdsO [Pseudoalteromonas sp. MMG010]